MTTTDFTIYIEPTKKEIIQRLFQEGHITFNEMWTLLQDEPEVKYVPMPQQVPYQEPWNPLKHPGTGDPLYPQYPLYTQDPAAYDTGNPRLHKFPRGGQSPEQP